MTIIWSENNWLIYVLIFQYSKFFIWKAIQLNYKYHQTRRRQRRRDHYLMNESQVTYLSLVNCFQVLNFIFLYLLFHSKRKEYMTTAQSVKSKVKKRKMKTIDKETESKVVVMQVKSNPKFKKEKKIFLTFRCCDKNSTKNNKPSLVSIAEHIFIHSFGNESSLSLRMVWFSSNIIFATCKLFLIHSW